MFFKKSLTSTNPSIKSLDMVVQTVIFLVFFLVPLFFLGQTAQGLGFEKAMLFGALVVIGLISWVAKGVISGEMEFKRTPFDAPIAFIILIFVLSTVFSVSLKDSLLGYYANTTKGLISLLLLFLFLYLLVNNLDTKRIKMIFWSLIASTALVTVYSFLQLRGIFLLPMAASEFKNFNPLGSLSSLSMFLVAMLPMLLIGLTQMKEFVKNKSLAWVLRIVLGIVLVLSLWVLYSLKGFTFWPVAIVGLLIVLMFFLSKIVASASGSIVIPFALFLIVLFFTFLGNFSFKPLDVPAEVSLSRSASWQIAKESLKHDPIFGSGPSTFFYSFSKYKNMDFNASPLWNVRFDTASGLLFELLATTGLLGALSFLIFGLVVFSVMYITLTKCGELEIKSIMLGFFASAISLALYSFLFTFNNSLMLIAGIIILAAAAISIAKYPEKFKIIKLSFRSSPKYALALSAIFLVVSAGVVVLFTMGFKMYQADMIALAAIQNGDDAKKIEYLEKALQLAPYQDNYRINLAGGYIVAANRAFFEGKNQAEISSLLGTAFKQGQQAVQNSSNNAGFLESMALIYENGSFYALDSLTFAENTYKQMMPLDPNSPTPYLRIALINMSRAKNESDETEKKVFYEEAIKQYDEALKRKMDLAQAYYGKAVVYEKMGDLNTAIEQLANANVASNNNLDYQFELGRVYYNRGASQSQLSQVASNDLASGSSTSDNLSVSGQSVSGKIDRNKDIEVAEQLFLSILNQNKDHSNSLYALAVIYRKVGEIDKAEVMINRLLEVIKADKDGVAKIREEFADILK